MQTPQDACPPERLGAREGTLRPTGIEVVGDAPWGTHFCQFYATKDDLRDVLVPYFKAGLEAGELCMWITSPPLGAEEAWAALARAMPDLEAYRARGRIEILPHTEWYLHDGAFDQERVLRGWVTKLEEALARGCAGLRLSGNTFWLEKSDWRTFAEYEAEIDRVLRRYPMLALCTYAIERCGASEVADVIRNHEFALFKREGAWEMLESFDRRRMQDSLAAERERLAVTLHSIGDAVIATDPEGRVTTLNRVAEGLTGWTSAEAVGRPLREVFRIVSEETGLDLEDPVRAVMERDAVVGLANHVALLRRDGSRVPIADSAAPIHGRAGERLGAVLVFRDVTAERRAEQALRESEQRVRVKLESILSPDADLGQLELADLLDAPALQSLMDQLYKLTHLPMAVIDTRGKVLVGVGWSEICTRFHRVHPETCAHCVESDTELAAGVHPGEFKLYKCKNNMWDVATPLTVGGHHLGNVFTGQFFFEDERPDRALFERQAARYGFDRGAYLAALDAVPRLSRETVNTGMAFFLRLSAMLSQLSYSNVHLARSVAERERLMASLRESKGQLEDADRRKDVFLGMLSHELRNPLAPIRNSLYILDHAPPTGEQARRAKEVANRQIAHITRLVDDLLDVTRIARGKIELRQTDLDLCAIARRTADDYRAVLTDRGLDLALDVPAAPVMVTGDETRLAQVLGNLLSNAAKFTPGGGRVRLSLRKEGDRAVVHVRDNGPGIAPEVLPTIFEPFTQGQQTLARSEGGLGLGLALVKGLVALHGGDVAAESGGPQGGTVFIVRLPLCRQAARAAPPGTERGRGATARPARRRVLIVDDNRDAADTLGELVELLGHEPVVAYDPAAALARAAERLPDLALCDIGLPGMTGYELARRLRAVSAGHDLRLFALSGYAQADDVAKAAEAGFEALLAKPADPEELAELLRGAPEPTADR